LLNQSSKESNYFGCGLATFKSRLRIYENKVLRRTLESKRDYKEELYNSNSSPDLFLAHCGYESRRRDEQAFRTRGRNNKCIQILTRKA
jgi:hypothetical protein